MRVGSPHFVVCVCVSVFASVVVCKIDVFFLFYSLTQTQATKYRLPTLIGQTIQTQFYTVR